MAILRLLRRPGFSCSTIGEYSTLSQSPSGLYMVLLTFAPHGHFWRVVALIGLGRQTAEWPEQPPDLGAA